jgi:PAS domain S-box-containing protein
MAGKEKLNKQFGLFNVNSKVIYILTSFIALLSISFYLLNLSQFDALSIKSLEDQSKLISQYIINKLSEDELKNSNRSKFSENHSDQSFNEEIITLLKKYKIQYFVFYDKDQLYKAYNLKEAEENHYLFTKNGEQITKNKKIFRMETGIKDNNFGLVKVYTGFSTDNYYKEIASFQKETAKKGLILFLGGTFLSFILSSLITNPIRKLVKGAEHYKKGDLNFRISYSRKNQFGIIAESLNSLSYNLSTANGQIENLNRQLKVLFRDKIGELNLEINQRRLAEHSLKQSEKQFRLLFERAPIGMVITSPDDKILKVNRAFCQSLGYSEHELSDKKTFDLIFLDDQPAYIKLHKQLLIEDLSNIYFENRFVRKDKEIIITIVEAVLIRGEDEKPHHFVSQVIDITERKRVEKELVKAKEKAEESDRLKTAFLAQMSHEIRTPLNVILAATPILADELPEGNEENDVLLDSITNAGKRLQRTIDMILNMSSVQSGNYVPEIEEVNLERELRNLTEEFISLTKNKNLELNFYNSVNEPFIMADKYTVNQIFQNLLGNAVKYTPKGEIRVSLYERDIHNICVEIKDSGIGMSREYMQKLFTPFSQEDIGYKREFEGNGLGLALVKKYVELNDAKISVESTKDKGSIFSVTFKNIAWHRLNPPAGRIKSEAV